MGNSVPGVGNYLIAKPLPVGNILIADSQRHNDPGCTCPRQSRTFILRAALNKHAVGPIVRGAITRVASDPMTLERPVAVPSPGLFSEPVL